MNIDKIELAKKFATNKFEEIGKKNHFLDVFQIINYPAAELRGMLWLLDTLKQG